MLCMVLLDAFYEKKLKYSTEVSQINLHVCVGIYNIWTGFDASIIKFTSKALYLYSVKVET